MRSEDERFDLLIRSLLEDAEEEVPSRVWSAVSAQLNKKARAAMWRRIGAVAAAVAAIAVGVFFVSTGNPDVQDADGLASVLSQESSPAFESRIEDVAVQAEGLSLIADVPSPDPVSFGGVREVKSPQALSGGEYAASGFVYAEGDGSEDKTVSNREPAGYDGTGETTTSEKGGSARESETFDGSVQAFWAGVDETGNNKDKRASKVSLTLGGDILSNGNPNSSLNAGKRFSSSTSAPTETTIKETSKASTYSIPLSVGIAVRYSFTDRWAIGAGITYSYLERTFTGVYTEVNDGVASTPISSDISNMLHYIGVPVNVYFNIIDNRVSLYAFGGGAVEKGVLSKYRVKYSDGDIFHSTSVDGLQWSAAVGFGVEFRLTDFLGLYIDPSLRYYFDTGQPVSIRTQQPLMLDFELGFRFDF